VSHSDCCHRDKSHNVAFFFVHNVALCCVFSTCADKTKSQCNTEYVSHFRMGLGLCRSMTLVARECLSLVTVSHCDGICVTLPYGPTPMLTVTVWQGICVAIPCRPTIVSHCRVTVSHCDSELDPSQCHSAIYIFRITQCCDSVWHCDTVHYIYIPSQCCDSVWHCDTVTDPHCIRVWHCDRHCDSVTLWLGAWSVCYRVATMSRLLKIISLFCRISSFL